MANDASTDAEGLQKAMVTECRQNVNESSPQDVDATDSGATPAPPSLWALVMLGNTKSNGTSSESDRNLNEGYSRLPG